MPITPTAYNFTRNWDNLSNTSLDPTKLTSVGAAPYTDILGVFFWGIIFALIFIMIWMRQEDITIPTLLGVLVGVSLWALMPPEWVSIAAGLTIVSVAGLMYSLLKGRT